MKDDLTFEFVSSRVEYDPESGLLRWKAKPAKSQLDHLWNDRYAGRVIDRLCPNGYICVRFDGRRYPGHRIAWLLHYGEWPSRGLDHIDRVRTNNAIANLREATKVENGANRKISRNNTTGAKGVSRRGNKWAARIWPRGKPIFLGIFESREEASTAYINAARMHFGEFASDGASEAA